MRTRSQTATAPTLDALPDEILQLVIAAFTYVAGDPPLFIAVNHLAFISKALLQQLHRVRPLVYIVSPSHGLAIVQRPAHGPWRVVLFYTGRLTAPVFEQARLGCVAYVKNQPLLSRVAQTSASWRSLEASLSARSRLRLPQAPASLGQSAAHQPLRRLCPAISGLLST